MTLENPSLADPRKAKAARRQSYLLAFVGISAACFLAGWSWWSYYRPWREWEVAIRDTNNVGPFRRAVEDAAEGNIRGLSSERAVSVLIGNLKDRDPDARRAAATALGDFGPGAKPAIPALIEALGDKNHEVRTSAVTVIGDLVGRGLIEPEKALVAVRPQLDDPVAGVRVAAVKALGSIAQDDPPPPGYKEALRLALKSPKDEVRMAAARHFAEDGEIDGLLPMIDDYLRQHSDRDCQSSGAYAAIAPLAAHDKAVVPLLVASTGYRQELRPMALMVLKDLASKDRPSVVSALSAGLKSDDHYVRAGSSMGLGFIGDYALCVPGLVRVLTEDDDPRLRIWVSALLMDLGPKASAAEPALKSALNDRNATVRRIAGVAIYTVRGLPPPPQQPDRPRDDDQSIAPAKPSSPAPPDASSKSTSPP